MSVQQASPTPVEQPSSSRSRRSGRLSSSSPIREAAAALFLEKGYQATSMDDIAAAAQVSKQTIYTHFANKDELFADLVLGNVDRVDSFLVQMEQAIKKTEDVPGSLRQLARLYIHFVIRPEVLRLRRLVLGEAARFPDLARAYYERVPARIYSKLADLLQDLASQGRLRLPDPQLAAEQFVWLTLGTPLDRGMFYPAEPMSAAELDGLADAAVSVFLAAYGATSPDRLA